MNRDNSGRPLAVAIDGPAGVGKSTAAKRLAEMFNLRYVDTGAMYRAIGYFCAQNGIALTDTQGITNALESMDISVTYDETGQHVHINGEDLTPYLRTLAAGDGASAVAKVEAVRKRLVLLQQQIARSNDVIMDGRDICTDVLPFAQVKLYMDASIAARTARRISELSAKGIKADYKEVEQSLSDRDKQDMSREFSPLRRAEDAILFDTSEMNFAQVVARLKEIIEEIIERERRL